MSNHLKIVLAFVLGQLTGIYGIGILANGLLSLLSSPASTAANAYDRLKVAILEDEQPRELIADIKEAMHPGIKIHSIQQAGDSLLIDVTRGKGQWAADCLADCDLEPDTILPAGYGDVTPDAVEALSSDWI